MIYVLYVHTGQEQTVMYALADKGYKAYIPRELYVYRKGGKWHEEIKPLFDSYVFLEIPAFSDEAYYDIKTVPGVGKFLSRSMWLSATEEEYIKGLCKNKEILKVSKGHIENGYLKIDSGYLKDYEHKIVKFSKRQHKAVIELTLYGEPHRITCAVDIS